MTDLDRIPDFRDRDGKSHVPTPFDIPQGLSTCGVLVERKVEGRRLRDILLVKVDDRWRLPGCELAPGIPVKIALMEALRKQLGSQVSFKEYRREPLHGRTFERFVDSLVRDRGWYYHVLVNVLGMGFGGMWKPTEGDTVNWVNWNDLARYDIAAEFVTALSEYKTDRIGGYRL